MGSGIRKWQRSVIRNNLDRYREAMEHYHVKDKRILELPGGEKVFSLLSPALGSAAAQRRVRLIMKSVIDEGTVVAADGAVTWGRRTPHFLTAAVTYRCQCACDHCSAEDYRRRATDDLLTAAELKDALAQAVDLGTTAVILTGGEPLLRDDLEDLVAAVDPKKAIVTIFTNGEGLTAARVRRLKAAGLFGVFVSLDAPAAAAHDRNRHRPGLFDRALAGIGRARAAGLLTGISTYVTRENLADGSLAALMDLGRSLAVLEVFLFDVIATGRLADRGECMLADEEIERVKEFRALYNKRPDYPRIIHQSMFTSIAYPCAAEGCPAGVAQLHLRGNGDVAPCDFTPFSFGNVRRKPLAAIWEEIITSEVYAAGSHRCRLGTPAYWDLLQAHATPV